MGSKEAIERTGQDAFRSIFFKPSGERWELQETELLERMIDRDH